MLLQLSTCFALVALTFAQDIMPGAPVPVDKGDTEYLDFAQDNVKQFFAKKTNQALGDIDIELIGSTSQVVAGVRYEYFFLVKAAGTEELCETSLWVRPWLTQNFITQLDDPFRCSSLDSVLASMEDTFNERSNHINYAKLSGEPIKLSMVDTAVQVERVQLTMSSCTKYDQAAGKPCSIPANSKPKFVCSGELYWANNGWGVANFLMRDL